VDFAKQATPVLKSGHQGSKQASTHDFKAKLDKHYPPQGKATQLSFEYAKEQADDTGKGL